MCWHSVSVQELGQELGQLPFPVRVSGVAGDPDQPQPSGRRLQQESERPSGNEVAERRQCLLHLVGLLLAFAIILYLGIRGKPLWITMGLATVILLLSAGRDLPATAALAARTAVAPGTMDLVGIVALITVLAFTLREFGLLGHMSQGLTATLRSDRLAFALIPGLLGCLPVPGGAGISAPMIDGLGENLGLERAQRAAANVIFRHAWFLVLPLEPALVLSAHLANVELRRMIAFQWPLTAVMLATGAFLFLRQNGKEARQSPMGGELTGRGGPTGHGKAIGHGELNGRRELKRLLVNTAPILVSLFLFLALDIPLILSLAAGAGVGCLLAWRKGTFSWAVLARSPDWSLIGATELIMIFAGLVSHSTALSTLVGGIAGSDYPLAAFLLIPAVLGLLTANPTAGVAIAFPVLWPLLPAGANPLIYSSLVFCLTFLTYLVSPLHMCLVLTNRYFAVHPGPVYRYLLPSAAVTTVVTLVLFLANR